jgi:hypothetical protein
MRHRPTDPSDMLPVDYAGLVATFAGLGLALRAAVIDDVALLWAATGVAAVGAALKVAGTRYKARLDRERSASAGKRGGDL